MSTYNVNPGSSSGAPSSGYTGSGGGTQKPVSPYTPPPQPAGPATDAFHGPGSIDFDLTDPQGALDKAHSESAAVFSGLQATLFGSNDVNAKGSHGTSPAGDIPVVGNIGRGIGNALGWVGGVAAALPGHVADAVGGTLERIPGQGNSTAVEAQLQQQFDALPEDSPAKVAALAQMKADQGFAGTGALSGKSHYMSVAIQEHEKTMEETGTPNLWGGLFRPAPSLADSVSNLFGVMGAAQRGAERLWAGAGTPGQEGMNRLQTILAVGDGHATFNEDKGLAGTGILAGDPTQGLNAMEQIVYDNVKSGAWGETKALDFLASRNQGFGHAAIANVGGSLALDPLNLATMGAGTLAKFGTTGVRLVKALEESQALLKAAEAAGDAEKIAEATRAVEVASSGIKDVLKAEGVGSRDVLGRIATTKRSGDIARRYGTLYGSLEGTGFGKMAKMARTVMDPFHAIDIKPRSAAALDEGSASVMHAVISPHGEFTHIKTFNGLRALDGGEDLTDLYSQGLAIYGGNVFRRVAGRQYRAVQMMMTDKGEGLIKTLPFQALSGALGGMKKRALAQLEEEAGQFVRGVWSADDDAQLSGRLASLWGHHSAPDWATHVAGMSGAQKSLLHAATYGTAIQKLHAARETVRLSGEAGTFTDRLKDLVLVNKTTLTTLGAEGILTDLAAVADDAGKVAVIRSSMQKYPELRNFGLDPTSDSSTIEEFLNFIERKKNFLPGQITNAERAGLTGALKDFDEQTRDVFTIGFRPKDEFLWGLERDGDGLLREVHDPWMDQVSDNLREYSAVREVPHNIAGKPIVGALASGTAKMLDYAEAAARTAFHGVTGKMVSQAAHVKFVEKVTARYADAGLTNVQVEGIWKKLMDKVDDSENISGIRGLSEDAIWNAAKEVIPSYASRAGLDRRALLVHVLDAYNGDVRYIGLTQKFTGKVKLLSAEIGLGNSAGMVAEHAWPLLKFRLNPFFQLQEKIEPWVLNAQRGASIALGTKTTAADREAMALYANFVEKNLVNMADNEIAELGRKMGWGKGMDAAARQEGGRMKFFADKLESMREVQGVKQLNMMRTFRKGLGKTMRDNWEEHQPGEWQKMLDHERGRTGSVVSEDDFAVHLAQSNLAANNIIVKDGVLDYSNAILEGQWAAPGHLGELRALDMEYMVHRINLRGRDGVDITTNQGMREALASGNIRQEDINRALRDMGAHKDYISRVESAYNFSWPVFWRSVSERFSLTDAERINIEGIYTRIANRRGMTPTEYMSQVYSPHIGRGHEAAVGSLGALVDATRDRTMTNLPDLGILRGIVGQTDIQNLYTQMGSIMAAHLDPSAKRAFLLDIMDPNGDGGLRRAAARGEFMTDIAEIEAAFTSEVTDALSHRIMNYLQGTPGSGPHALVADERTGVASIRNAATEFRTNAGRPRNVQRAIHEDSDDMARLLADALDGMTGEYDQVATAEELARVIEKDMVAHHAGLSTAGNFKTNEFTRLPVPVRGSYEARVLETRRLYNHITQPASEGGLGIKITASRTQTPYASADALRADLAAGKLKVPNSGYWHPLIHNEDLYMERVVSDVFGHGQEANAFGSHDAIMSAAAMYSDEARGTLLADGFARQAWETHGSRVIEQPTSHPTTIEEFENWRGAVTDRPERMVAAGLGPGATVRRPQSRTIGTELRAAAPEVQREFIETAANLHRLFPGVQVHAWDLGNIPAAGVTLQYKLEHPTIVLATDAGWQSDPVARAAKRSERMNLNERAQSATKFRTNGGAWQLRKSDIGTPSFTSATPTGDLTHEFGHALDIELYRAFKAKRGKAPKPGQYLSKDLTAMMKAFKGSDAQKMLSEYSYNITHVTPGDDAYALRDSDMFAELFDLAFNPEHEQTLEELYDTDLRRAVMQFQDILEREGHYVPDGVEAAVHPHAGKTIAEANAAGAAIRAPYKMGSLPQPVLDEVTQHFIGSGRYAEANPDIGRMAGYLRNHMRDVTGHTLQTAEASPYSQFFDSLSGMPVDDAESVPFDFTQATLWHGAAQMMAAKWQDAFRLQYFAQNRSMFQRSLNHPMFGLYPASYMWGKIGPELVRFMATEPFGVKTGAGAYTLMDLQKSVAMQRQYDPEFQKGLDDLGTSPSLGFLGYMLPATPWSVPASYPAWLRNFAEQGLKNKAAFEAGAEGDDIDFMSPLMASVKKIFPMSTQLPWLGRVGAEVGDALPWNAQPEPVQPQFDPSGALPITEPPPTSQAVDEPPAPATPPTGAVEDLAAPVTAMGTQDLLAAQMADLTAMLSG